MDDTLVMCPYCAQLVNLEIDPEDKGVMVEDCQVCCRPWQVFVSADEEGFSSVEVRRAD